MTEGVLSAIGHTPLVRLRRLEDGAPFRLFGKLEGLNPAGSSKDRAACEIVRQAWEAGSIGPDTVVIESSSGNMGIGLAQVCGYLGLRLVCVVDPKAAPQNIEILRAYGAEVDRVEHPDPETGEFLQARLARVKRLVESTPHAFWPNQYANRHNAAAHRQTTMHEIVTALGEVDYLFCAISTCGTIRGCSEYVAEHGLRTKVVAVDAIGSRIFGCPPAPRLVPGLGAGITPELCDPSSIDRCVWVSDTDCVVGCRRLVRREAILAGGSSGAVVMAVEQLRHEIAAGAVCVAILPDRGERYLDTIYSDAWVEAHFGDVSRLWARKAAGHTPEGMTWGAKATTS
jgi:N-(2-amino-2-carboxyethyl)-L-glutamate synthase